MKRNLTALLILLICNLASAQTFKLKQKLPTQLRTGWVRYINDSNIYASGFIFGGEILHYNGYSWKSYKRTNYPTIFEQEVTADGRIWLGTIAGMYLIDTTKLNPDYDNIPLVMDGIQITDSVTQLASIGNKLWFTTNSYLACIQNEKVTIYNKDTVPYLSDLPKITDLAIDNNDNVLLATPNGVLEINPNYTKRHFSENAISRFHKDKTGEIWFADMIRKVLYRWNNGQPIQVNTSTCKDGFLEVGNISSNENGDIFMWGGNNDVSISRFRKPLYGIYSTNDQRYYSTDNSSGALDKNIVFVDSYNGLFALCNDSLLELNIDSLKGMLNVWSRYTTELDANNLRMPIISDALFGWNLGGHNTDFPTKECKSVIFCGSLWLGGMTNDSKKVAAQTYRQRGLDYYPGPIRKHAGQLVLASYPFEQSAYYKPRKVTKAAIDKFRSDFAAGSSITISPEINNWPAHGDTTKGEAFYLAPFVDVNQDGKYNPNQGDYPDIKGDMAVYNIINDNIFHSETQGTPFGIEIHLMAYAYACSDMPNNSPNQPMNNTVLFQYKIINRSDTNYQGIIPGIHLDVDIGGYNDDHLACNPKLGYAYGFNGDAYDESFPGIDDGFGNRPATISLVPLGADSNKSYLKGMVYYNNDFSRTGNPSQPEHYSSYLNAHYKDNSPITYGGKGNDTTSTPAMYMFPGDDDLQNRPHWSMKSAGMPPQDMRMLSILTPFNLNAGADTTFTIAFVASLPIDSASTYQTIKNDVVKVKGWFAANSFPTCGKLISGVKEDANSKLDILVYPNPAQHTLNINHSIKGEVDAQIVSMEGKVIWSGKLIQENTIDIQDYTAGLYVVHIKSSQGFKAIKWIKE